jgi:hypothetical protein
MIVFYFQYHVFLLVLQKKEHPSFIKKYEMYFLTGVLISPSIVLSTLFRSQALGAKPKNNPAV